MERNADIFRDESGIREAVRDIVDMRLKGLSFHKIADEYGCGYWVIFGYYSRAAEKDYYGYDPLCRDELMKLLSSPERPFTEVAYLMRVSPEGLKNYLMDRDITLRTLPKPSTVDAETFTTDDPVLGEFLKTGRVTAKMCAYYGISYISAKNWAVSCGFAVRKANEKDERLRVEKIPEEPSRAGMEMTAKDLLELRCQGRSFADIAKIYGSTKMNVYRRFSAMRAEGFDGAEPYDIKKIREALESDESFSEIALSFGLRPEGLSNYVLDMGIYGRTLPFFEEIIRDGAEKEARIRVALSYLKGEIPLAAVSHWFGLSIEACGSWSGKTLNLYKDWEAEQERKEEQTIL